MDPEQVPNDLSAKIKEVKLEFRRRDDDGADVVVVVAAVAEDVVVVAAVVADDVGAPERKLIVWDLVCQGREENLHFLINMDPKNSHCPFPSHSQSLPHMHTHACTLTHMHSLFLSHSHTHISLCLFLTYNKLGRLRVDKNENDLFSRSLKILSVPTLLYLSLTLSLFSYTHTQNPLCF